MRKKLRKLKKFNMVDKKYNTLHSFLRQLIDNRVSIRNTGNYVYRIIYLWGMNTACVDRCDCKGYHRPYYKPTWENIGVLAIDKRKKYNPDVYDMLTKKVG